MEGWLEFGRGPLFRLCFVLMVLGLLRTFLFSLLGMIRARRRAGDRAIPWWNLTKSTIGWLFPVGRLWRARPVYSAISFIWHIGLILVPLFLGAHVLLWKRSLGFAWFTIPQQWADILALTTIIASFLLFIGRVGSREARALSRRQDYLWPLLIALPFISGFFCVNVPLSSRQYEISMLIHVYSANVVMVSIPFTKVAHCVLLPLSQFVSGIGWKFPQGVGDRVAATLGKKEMPV